MIRAISNLIRKYKSMIAYLFFGACTTLVDVAVYYLCYRILEFKNIPSVILSWICAVIFAFITNKLFVFESRSFAASVLLREAVSFFGCRLLTGLLDIAVMYVAVDLMDWNATAWKLISNVLVIILNYVASKLIVFQKKKQI